MKRFISLVLSLSIVMSLFGGLDLSVFATTETTNTLETELIDIDIYKAQCLAGIAEDPNSDAVERCRNLYNYYFNEELFSPTQTFLQEAYADETLMMNFNEWKAYSLGADASTALNQPLAKKDYYESLIIALFSQSLNENSDMINDVNINAAATAANVVDNLCAVAEVTTEAELISYFSNAPTSVTKSALEGALAGTKIASDALFVIDIVLGASSTIVDAVERIALYSEMLNLDSFTKQWIAQMYNACDEETDAALKLALYNLKNSSASFAESLLVEISDSAFRVRTWAAGTTVNTTLGVLAASNPISASVLAGLKLGKTICDIFYCTSDVYEQFYMLECIYNVEKLSRTVAENCEADFTQNSTNQTAKTFIYAVDCYFECLINVEVDCMINFLDILYNGGLLKGTIVWMYGATDDYQEAVNALESLREVRQNNYDLMITYFKVALAVNYPDTYDYYFTVDNTIPITDISFMTSRILPPPYPAGYANMIVGDFANINVQYVPSNTTQRAYTVTSDNPEVVSVNDNVMTAVSVGTANVTVTSIENPNVSFTAEIKVGEKIEDGEIEEITTWFTYTVDENDNATITGLIDGYEPSNLTIPSKIQNYSVAGIGNGAFKYCTFLKNVNIPDSVVTIGSQAFRDCTSLTDIVIPEGVKNIDFYTFYGCTSLEKVTIPKTVVSIEEKAFAGCHNIKDVYITDLVAWCEIDFDIWGISNPLYYAENFYLNGKIINDLVIPTEVTEISGTAFSWHTFNSVTIHDQVTKIAAGAFEFCSIKDVYIYDLNCWCNINFVGDPMLDAENLFLNGELISNLVIPNGITKIPNGAFSFENITNVTIPETVTSIGESAFQGCGFNNIYIPDSVTDIGRAAFYGCNLNNIAIPQKVTTINDFTFGACSQLESITIPESIIYIGEYAFEYCSKLEELIIHKGLETISYGTFEGCTNLKNVYYEGSQNDWETITIESENGELTNSKIHYGTLTPHDVVAIIEPTCTQYGYTEYTCSCGYSKITDYTDKLGHDYEVSQTVLPTCIENGYVKYDCTRCNESYDESIEASGHKFTDGFCSVCEVEECWEYSLTDSKDGIIITKYTGGEKEVIIPNEINNLPVTTIGYSVFEDCNCIESIYIPQSITSIKGRAFSNCENLQNVYITDIKAWCETEFEWPNSSPMYYATNLYVNDELITDLIIPDGITYLPHYAFSCENIETVTIPDSVLSMGQGVFENCTNLESVYITDIESWCQIDYNASQSPLYYANNLYVDGELITDLIIPDGITEVPAYAFSCQNIKSVIIPDSVTTIEDGAFEGCFNMTTITIPSSITSIDYDAFNGCYGLDSVYILDLASWCNIDFSYYGNPLVYANDLYLNGTIIKDLIIPDGVEIIKTRVFEGCASIKTITVPDSVVSIGDWAFQSCSNVFSIMLPITLTDIGYSTFNYCYSLDHVVYAGSQDDWNEISIGNSNEQLTSATIHYNCSNDVIYSETITPTCTEEGQVTHKCELCELEIVEQVEALGHNGIAIETIAPTCTNDGYTVYQCSECGETYNADWVYSTDHTKGDVIESVNPSCTQDGYTRYSCSVCGVTFTTDWVWSQGHTKGEIVSIVDPTCEESGYTIYSCSVCSLTFKSDWIYSDGHTQGEVIEVVEATCTQNGYTKYQCSSCNEEFMDNWTYATGHSGEAINSIGATCIEKGYTEFLCNSCGETYNSDFTSPLGHSFENDICVNCNKLKEDCIESSHNYENNCDETWIISKPNADYITITFSSATETESGWDYIDIYDMDDNLIGQFTGTELASQTITVTGNMVKIRLTSDSSVNKYGFAVSDICSYIKFSVNDVEVAMPENTIDSTAELRVDEIDINNIVAVLPEEFDVTAANVYDIYFEKEEQRVQPNGAVTVYILVPSDMDGEKCKVFHIDEFGNATDMNAVYENGYMVFTTEHFSYYVLVEEQVGFVYGDANGDTVIDGRDVVRLKNYLANYDYDTETSTVEIFDGADANGDGIIDGRDVIRLKNYLANYDYDTDSSTVILGPQN